MNSFEDLKNKVFNNRNNKTDEKPNNEKVSTFDDLKTNIRNNQNAKNVDRNYINNFLNQYNDFFSSAEKDYNQLGWGNASATYDTRYKTSTELNSSKGAIESWFKSNSNQLDDQSKQILTDILGSYDKDMSGVMDAFKSAKDYYGQWDSEEAYQRDYSLNEQYGDLSYDELLDEMEYTDDNYTREWLTHKADSIATKDDYSNTISRNQEEIEKLEEMYDVASIILDSMQNSGNDSAEYLEQQNAQLQDALGPYKNLKDLEAKINQLKNDTWNTEKKLNYNYLEENADFSKLSKPSTENTSGFGLLVGNRFYGKGDAVYDYINDINGERARRAKDESDGELKKYANMSADEIARYNYIHNTQGKKAAGEYLDYLEPELDKEFIADINEEVAAYASREAGNASVLSTFATMASGIGFLDAAAQKFSNGIKEAVTGEYAGPVNYNSKAMIASNAATTIRKTVSENLADKYGRIEINAEKHPLFARLLNGKSWGDVYQLGMSMVDSSVVAVLSTVVGPGAAFLLGGSAATQGMLDAIANGATDEQALMMGLLNGTFETIFEKYEVEHLLGADTNLLKAIFNQAITESVGEGATSIANTFADVFVMAENSQFHKLVAEYESQGLEHSTAIREAIKDTAIQIVWDAVGGLLMGGVSGGGASIFKSALGVDNATQTTPGIDQTNIEQIDSFVPQGNVNVGSEKNNPTIKSADQQQTAEQSEQTQNEPIKHDPVKMESAAKRRLEALGETENVDTIANLAARRASGEELKRSEITTLAHSQFGAKVAKELAENKLKIDTQETEATKANATEHSLKDAVATAIDGKTMTVKLADGTVVDSTDMELDDYDQSTLVATVPAIEHITPEAATVAMNGYDPASGVEVSAYVSAFDEAYTYGFNSYSMERLSRGKFAPVLSAEQMQRAYELGREARRAEYEAADTYKETARKKSEEGVTEAEKTAKLRERFVNGKSNVYFMDGTNVTEFDENQKYTDRQKSAVKAAQFFTKMGIGGQYVFFRSEVKNGRRVFTDIDGVEKNAPNGIYRDSTGTIYIDMNAGNYGQGYTLFTLGHELTHFVKGQSKKQFAKLADYVTEAFDKTNRSMHQRVLDKQSELTRLRGEDVSYDEAFEEVVADAMSTMIADENFYDKVMEIKAKDEGLYHTIRRFFKNLVARFVREYNKLTPDQKDARDIREMKDMFDKIQTAFAEALVDASENFHATEGQKNTTEVGGEKMMVRSNVVDVNGKVYSKVVKPGLTVYDKVKHSKKSYVDYLHTKIFKRTFNLSSNDSSSIVVEFAKQNERVKKDGDKTPRRALGELEATEDRLKMIAIINIRDLLKNSEPLEPSSENSHQWLDAGGWRDRISYMEDHNDVYPVILHIPKTRDGRYLLYDVSVIKDEGSTVDIDATALASSNDGRASDTKEDGVRSAVKSIEPSGEKITQPDSKVKNESAEAVGFEVDAKTESVAPKVMNSERTWTSSDYVQERNKAAKEIAKAIGVTEQKAKDYIDSINSIAKMIAEDRSRLDYFSSPGRSSFVDNAEYGGSFDFSTLCKKRRLLTGTFTAIQKALPNTALTADEILDIRNRMKEADLEVSCGLCYVEGSRANMGQFSKEFLRLYKQYYPDAWQPNMVDVNTPDGVEWMRINHPEAYEQYEYFWNHYGTLKEGDKNLFASQQKPKLYQLHTEYKGEILNKFKNDDKVEDKNLNGGIRLQSFSDFEIVHLIDTMQIIMDMSRVGLAGQAYTKVPDFAWALGDTGLKINLSLIAKGVDENGNLIFDDVEGMPISEAMKLRDRYSKNVGTILVAFNDQQLLAAMADEKVDFIIPFHRSQWKKSQYEAMGLPAKTKDYTFMQNEKYINPQFHEFRGRLVKDKATNYMPNEYWDFSKSGKENAEAYLEMCARNNKRPKFYKLLQNNGDGSYSMKADGSTDGYWKLLIDFKMYDNEGNGSPQTAVKPDFNMGEAQRMLNDYSGGHSNFPVAQGIVEGFVNDYKNSHKGQKLSERASNKELAGMDDTALYIKNSDRVSTGEKFSLRSPVEETADLVAFHNITPQLLMDVLNRKVLLMPSLAITNKGMTDFGEISLVFDKNTIDPSANSENKLYGADAWTPTQTQLKKNAKFDTNKTVNAVNSLKNSIGSEYVQALFNITAKQFKEAIIRADGSIYDAFAHSIGMQTAYAMEKGIISEIPTTKSGKVNKTALHEQLNAELDTDNGWRQYKRWLNNISDTVITSYDKASNEDILRNMKAQPASAKTFKLSENGELVVPAVEYSSIEDMRKNKSRLSENAAEETKAVADEFLTLAKEIGNNTKSVVNAINVAFADRYSTSNIVKSFESHGIKISAETAGKLQDMYKKAVELPTQYFEAKPHREVGLNEIETVIMPKDEKLSELKSKLEDLGITITEYNADSKTERVKALNSVEKVKFSERGNAPTFYSQMGKVVEGMKQEKFGASSVISMLRGKGVKAEEIRWSGIQAFLDGKKSVTKQELLDFINSSMLQIEETMLSGTKAAHAKLPDNYRLEETTDDNGNPVLNLYIDDKLVDTFEQIFDGSISSTGDSEIWAMNEADLVGQILNHYAGMSYDEAYLTEANGPKWGEYKLDGGENYRELVFKMPGATYTNNAMRGHWGNDAQGVLAHARMQDFDVDGKKMLFIEEIQSDWHNEGHTKGYESAEYVDYNAKFGELEEKFRNSLISEDAWARENDRLLELEEQQRKKGIGTVPNAPFKDNYHEFVLKRLIRMAAEEGYDSIGWTTADIQSERWSDEFAEGYRIEYDQDIPKFLKKYGKQWGAEVGKTVLDNGTDVWSMAITDAMKKSVLTEGQAMYSERGEGSSNRALIENAAKIVEEGSSEQRLIQRYQDNASKLDDLNRQLGEINSEIKNVLRGSKEAKNLSALEKKAETIVNEIDRRTSLATNLENSKGLQEIIQKELETRSESLTESGIRLQEEYWLKKEVKQIEALREYRETNAELRQKQSDISVMENEFVRLMREYEKESAKSNRKDSKNADKISNLKETVSQQKADLSTWKSEFVRLAKEYDKQQKIHERDEKTWGREFDRLVKEYEAAGRSIERLENKIVQQKENAKRIAMNRAESKERTELRHKIRKTVRDLDKILNRGNKKRNVKEDMRDFVSKALDIADYLFTDHISNDELIRRGIDPKLIRGEKEARLVQETEEIIAKLDAATDINNPDMRLSDAQFAELDAKRKDNEYKLRELLTAQRNEWLSTPVYQLFDDLVNAYASLKNSNQEAVKAAYNEQLEMSLRSFMSNDEQVKILKNMRVTDMTTEELNWLYRAYTMVLTNVRKANEFFVEGMKESVDQVATQIVNEFGKRKIPDKKVAIAAQKLSNKFGWNYEKLYYALDRIGSEAFTKLMMNLANSENIVMADVIEAAIYRDRIVEKYGFNDWDINKKIDREFLDNNGKKFTMTLGEMMSLYAYSRRKGAWDHIEYGGFVFGKAALTNPKPADSYKLNKDQCEAITNLLTEEQKNYVKDMQKFLSETMGAKGNEVSMLLYGIKMFNESAYFPIHIAGDFMAKAEESQAKASEGFQSMSNAGFTHAQNPNAKAPFVLESFNEVWVDHVNEMSRYHGTVPALEDIRRVMNRSSYSESTAESTSVKAIMKNQYGEDAVQYFNDLYKEANSGAINYKLQQTSKKMLSLFRKTSVAYSLSVLVQQPAAIVRAYAMIDRRYFGVKGVGTITSALARGFTKDFAKSYNEMLKYAPGVTMAKEIGGFDTATGGSIRTYLMDTKKSVKQKWKTENAKGKAGAVLDLVDNNPIANLPNLADKIAWIEIWNACKKETIAKHKDLSTGSEEFMQLVGDRFTEVIRATQVYDSIFAKSPMLKSKNLAVQYLVSFMNEPNTTANMAESAVRDIARGDWKQGLKKAYVVSHSIIFTGVMKSLIYAMRDDDEDETYIEKYIESLTGSLMDDFNPLNYIPIARDAWSIAQGYDVERADMAIVSDAIGALNNVIKNANTSTDGMTEEQLIKLDKKQTEANWKLVEAIATCFGIPVKNIRREIKGLLNVARNTIPYDGKTTGKSLWDKIMNSAIESIPFMESKAKKDNLYDVILSGDAEYLERLKQTYKDEDAYHSAVRKALRDNDPRIREAAQAYYDGNIEEYKRIFRQIQNEIKLFDFNDIMSAVMTEVSDIKGETEPKNESSDYSSTDFVNAILVGDTGMAEDMREDIIQFKLKDGKTQEEAEESFAESVKDATRNAFDNDRLDDAGAKNMLLEYADMDEKEAEAKVEYWNFVKENPKYKDDFNQSRYEKYRDFAEPADIPLGIFVQYVNRTAGIETIKDEWGNEVMSVREQVLDVIDSLNLTWQQKDALYLAHEYAESKIFDVPW